MTTSAAPGERVFAVHDILLLLLLLFYSICGESSIGTRWPAEVLGKHTRTQREMSWSIITRERRSFVYFFPSATRCYYPVAIDLSAGLSIYYYVLIRCCSGLWESDPTTSMYVCMCVCVYTVFFFFLDLFYIIIILFLLY
jgi:hypothetical protein